MSETKKYESSCHCGKVRFEVEGKIESLVRCNCSICKRRGHVLWFVPKSSLNFLSGEEELSVYQFGEKIISHCFCPTCGVSMLSDGEMNGVTKAGLNLNCFVDLDISTFEIFDYDGAAI